jgi:hypothetical protein
MVSVNAVFYDGCRVRLTFFGLVPQGCVAAECGDWVVEPEAPFAAGQPVSLAVNATYPRAGRYIVRVEVSLHLEIRKQLMPCGCGSAPWGVPQQTDHSLTPDLSHFLFRPMPRSLPSAAPSPSTTTRCWSASVTTPAPRPAAATAPSRQRCSWAAPSATRTTATTPRLSRRR